MKQYLIAGLLIITSCAGCLKFGDDEETTSPTSAQVDRCRREMYINPSVELTPLGYKLLGSGIDDAIWFKFPTSSTHLTEVFDGKVVDTAKFETPFTHIRMKDVKWWDVEGKTLLGAQVSLPNARFMNVGVQKTDAGFVIYIMWTET